MLHRVVGYGLLQQGDATGAAAAFDESLRLARDQRAQYQVALTLAAITTLRPSPEQEAERDAILAELAVVALPPAPTRMPSVSV